ncbi:hypothetical protein BDZ89DRAFT_1139384 [Hymenopellis radicata]|nr:hypothetical protein BDZ89DRAFT_1139384 [Hymenopellis radicata]
MSDIQPEQSGSDSHLNEAASTTQAALPEALPEPTVEQPRTTATPRAAGHSQSDRHIMGLKQSTTLPGVSQPIFSDDYEQKFPEDPYCQETAPNARLWRTYVEEAAIFDEVMVGQSREGLDVMLVFAGLFSAVVTSFLVQVSQNLKADFSEMSVLLLHDIAAIQLSMAGGASITNITNLSINPAQKFTPDAIDVLTAALVVALAAVLVKQWLHHYVSLPSGTASLRSHVRQFRFLGLERWRVRVIIGMLPIVMHVSLMLFLGGLCLFFIPLRVSLAWTIGVITVVVCVFYFASNAIPIFLPQCPYHTPLSDFLQYISHIIIFVVRLSWQRIHGCLMKSTASQTSSTPEESFVACQKSLLETETEVVHARYDLISVDAMDWLFHMSSNPSVRSIVLQAIGGLPETALEHAQATWTNSEELEEAMNQLIIHWTDRDVLSAHRRLAHGRQYVGNTIERVFRSSAVLSAIWKRVSVRIIHLPVMDYVDIDNPRIQAVLWCFRHNPWTPAVHSEFLHFLLAQHETQLHPILWKKMLELALSQGTFRVSDQHLSARKCARLVALMLPNPEDRSLKCVPSPMTVRDFISAHSTPVTLSFTPARWDYLMQMPILACNDGMVISPITREHALLAIGKFALTALNDGPLSNRNMDLWDVQGWQCIELLSRALYHFGKAGGPKGLLPESSYGLIEEDPPFMSALYDFLLVTMQSCVFVHELPSTGLDDWERIQLNGSLPCVLYIYRYFSRSKQHFSFPLIQKLFAVSVSRLFRLSLENYELIKLMHSVYTLYDILTHSLSRGCEEGIHIFVEGDWIPLAAPIWIQENSSYPHSLIMEAYVCGSSMLFKPQCANSFWTISTNLEMSFLPSLP